MSNNLPQPSSEPLGHSVSTSASEHARLPEDGEEGPKQSAATERDLDLDDEDDEVRGIRERGGGRGLTVVGDEFKGREGARRILDAIKSTHSFLRFKWCFASLGEDGLRCLLDGLRQRSRSSSSGPDDFRLESVALHICDPGDYLEGFGTEKLRSDALDLLYEISAWALPIILDTFFGERTDFPHLSHFCIRAHWEDGRIEDVRKVMSDARLENIDLGLGIASLPLVIAQLESLLDRIEDHPQAVDIAGLLCVGPGPDYDDGRYELVEDLVLEVLQAGSAGVRWLGACECWIFNSDETFSALTQAILENDWLMGCSLTPKVPPYYLVGPPEGTQEHLYRNNDRIYSSEGALLAIVVPARILLFAKRASNTSVSQLRPPQVRIPDFPPEIIHLILHQLSHLVADDLVLKEPFRESLDEPLDARPSPREIEDMIRYASDLETVHRERRFGWPERLMRERRLVLMQREHDEDAAR